MKPNIFAVDLAKNVFQICLYDPNSGKVVFNKAVRRAQFFKFVAKRVSGIIAMEACSTAHYWGRRFRDELNLKVLLVSPQHVSAMRKNAKNDRNDALAIAETVLRPKMIFVEIKTIEQQEVQALHRVRARLQRDRIAVSNQIRGLLLEFGVFIPASVAKFRQSIPLVLEDAGNDLSPRMRVMINDLYHQYVKLADEEKEYSKELESLSRQLEPCKRLKEIEGFGSIGATALWASLGNAQHFRNGRQAAASLGVVPKQFGSGGKTILGHINKKVGDPYLRRVLVQGAKSVINTLGDKQDAKSCWLRQLVARVGKNRAAIALVNKHIRIAWAMLSRGERYNPALAAAC